MASKLSVVRKVTETYAKQVVAEMRTRLRSFGKLATGTLYRSLGYTVVDNEKNIDLAFHAEDYFIYVDKGRRPGKQPPLNKIKEWCRVKHIPVEAAFPIARKIGREGIPATNFFTLSTTRRQSQFEKKLESAFAQDFEAALAKELRTKK